MSTRISKAIALAIFGSAGLVCTAFAAPPCGTPPCGGGPPDGGESTAGNNLSFPVIFSDGMPPGAEGEEGYPNITPEDWIFYSGPWSDANGDGVLDQCTTGVPVGSPVPDTYVCYQSPDLKVWWLQERVANKWQAFDPPNAGVEPVVVSALDWGDLLESSPNLNLRKIRTEVWLLKDVDVTDAAFGAYLPDKDPGGAELVTCGANAECFAAFRMSGAVPGSEQSINEVQGTDFGASDVDSTVFGTRQLIDPASVKFELVGGLPRGYEATVYSSCARLLIQPLIEGVTPEWDAANGVWAGAGDYVINVRALDGGYSAEINAGGFMLYGYNWSAKGLTLGKYRLTFVLDGPDSAYACPGLKTHFDSQTSVFVTPVTEPAAMEEPAGPEAVIVPNCAYVAAGTTCVENEGGLSYIDVTIAKAGGRK